jgi:hypothetical protein
MAGIKDPIVDIMSKARAMLDINQVPLFQTVRVWNNQVEHERDGQYVAYAKPANFVEILTDVQWGPLGEGYSTADIGVKFHLIHEYMDDQAGNFEQDLAIFDLRDAVIKAFNLYAPPGCGRLMKVNEVQDMDHTNIYHYIIEFVCSFVDSKGAKEYTQTTPPTTPDIQAVFIDPKNYIIETP